MFLLEVCLGDALLPPVADSSFAWIVVLVGEWAASACLVAGIGLIGLFPTGVPQRAASGGRSGSAAAMAALLPVLLMVSSPHRAQGPCSPAPRSQSIASPLFLPAARPLEPVAAGLLYTFAAWGVARRDHAVPAVPAIAPRKTVGGSGGCWSAR